MLPLAPGARLTLLVGTTTSTTATSTSLAYATAANATKAKSVPRIRLQRPLLRICVGVATEFPLLPQSGRICEVICCG